MENDNNLKNSLIQKLEKEMKDFKSKIKEKGVDFAINMAYELTSKQEIIDYIQHDIYMSIVEMKALISRENLLDELYSEWLETDGNMREHIGYSVDNSLDLIRNDYMENIKKNKNYER